MPPDTDLGPILLARARQAIECELDRRQRPPVDDPRLDLRAATFVTLTDRHGDLRGCMGSIRPQRPLREDIADNAVAAATRDPRFPPVTARELDQLHVEVSLLSSPEFVDFASEADLLSKLRPGIDGVILFAGCRSATFLPQVWEKLPDPASFLAALKRKAGIAPDHPAAGLMAATYTVTKWKETQPAGSKV